jgi:hypothetical protein
MLSCASYNLTRFSVALGGDGAGINDVNVAIAVKGAKLEARPLESLGYRLGFVL